MADNRLLCGYAVGVSLNYRSHTVRVKRNDMEGLAFFAGIVIAFAAVPYAIFRFVVSATERDLIDTVTNGDSEFVAEGRLWAAFKSGLYFALLGPVIGTVLSTTLLIAPIVIQEGGNLWELPLLSVAVFPITLAMSIGGAFVAGLVFGISVPVLSVGHKPAWWARLLIGAASGAVGGLLLQDFQKLVGTGVGLSLCAGSGAVCGFLVAGRIYRRIFLAPKATIQ